MKSTSEQSQVEHERNVTSPSTGTVDVKVARVQALLHGLSLVMTHHSAPFEVIQSLREQAEEYLAVDEEEKFLKRAKYMILWPMSVYLKNEEPPAADQPFHFRGRFWRWARQRLNCYSRKNTHLWYSFLQSKRAALPVTPEVVLSNFQKHRSQMESADPLREGCEEDEELLNEVMENLEPILRKLRAKLYGELKDFFRSPGKEIHKASESASYESSRKLGGQAGHIRHLLGVTGIREPEQLFSMREHAEPTKGPAGVLFHQIGNASARYGELQDLEEELEAEVAKVLQVPIYKAQVEAVLEPFKVRTISKGESLPYYLAKRVQLVLHGAMRKMDCFRLIGRPLDVPDLADVRSTSEKFLDTTQNEWLSIDYSAATDGLSALLSSNIMKELLDPLYFENPQLYNMMLGVLAPHEVHYPKVAGVQLPPVLQKNGQLMGSVLSFPVLCLANLGLYMTVRRRVREVSTKNLLASVLVNGDDMLYIGSSEEWKIHTELGARIGLAMSAGKAYKHPRYANINSTSVDYDLTSKVSTPIEVKFLNVGLMVGMHKVQGKVGSDDESKTHPLTSVIDKVVEGALPGKQAEVFKRYCAMHAKELELETRGRNLFLSPQIGGLGVKPILGVDTTVTPRQWSIAIALLDEDRYLRPDFGVLPQGHLIRDLEDVKKDPIRVQPTPEIPVWRFKLGETPLPSWVLQPRWVRFLPQ